MNTRRKENKRLPMNINTVTSKIPDEDVQNSSLLISMNNAYPHKLQLVKVKLSRYRHEGAKGEGYIAPIYY
jgi:hypothetical protein